MFLILQTRDLVVAYDGRPVLRGVSLGIAPGEVVALLGANGSGKSTLVKASLGLTPIASGSVELFGEPLAKLKNRSRIGYVPQRVGASSGVPATVRELVSAGRLARRGFLRPARAADRRAVDSALVAVGLATMARQPVGTLSGGQQQRALIARALCAEPELLVMDEPTAGVDAASQQAFAAALRQFVAGGGTVVVVLHELGPLEPLITRSVVLHGGTIAHDGAAPAPAPGHACPDHVHEHPHAPVTTPRWELNQ
ncbi:metal ABC transporter ATP-binding protein [Longispora fulva]|uniref:Zinc transport system ATP-binding protein n=1 Tax=Longispora fulva TaxID=619741 RepID=A0A8J7GGH6_9ACTN|nr:metal ABC transporter ATP-binding protein [Longispora fulva]MBG6138549.1 zinc transport system ATP-binding protein [Longispora fulva]